MNNTLKSVIVLSSLFLAVGVTAQAHVVVKPSEVGVGAFQTFTVGVPNEKDNPVVEVRLLIPDGLNFVSPNVKPGWKIDIKNTGEGEGAKVTEINWTGGSIPVGQRDDFYVSAQVPAKETKMVWKAYQKYQNGTVISWDSDPSVMKNMSDEEKEENEKKGKGPYSETEIVNDLKNTSNNNSSIDEKRTGGGNPMIVSYAALALSMVAMGMSFSKKNK